MLSYSTNCAKRRFGLEACYPVTQLVCASNVTAKTNIISAVTISSIRQARAERISGLRRFAPNQILAKKARLASDAPLAKSSFSSPI